MGPWRYERESAFETLAYLGHPILGCFANEVTYNIYCGYRQLNDDGARFFVA